MFGVSLAFYGAPKTHLRIESWDLLRSLHKKFSVSWIYACDFNELLKSHEKLGGFVYVLMVKWRSFEKFLMSVGCLTWDFREINSTGLKVIQIEA